MGKQLEGGFRLRLGFPPGCVSAGRGALSRESPSAPRRLRVTSVSGRANRLARAAPELENSRTRELRIGRTADMDL
ncbi:hypothetical protein AOLI_G00256280 [Acnodon oligacanthus]